MEKLNNPEMERTGSTGSVGIEGIPYAETDPRSEGMTWHFLIGYILKRTCLESYFVS